MTAIKGGLSDHDKGLLRSIEDQYNMVHGVLGPDPLIYYRFSVLPPIDEETELRRSDLAGKRQTVYSQGPVKSSGLPKEE